MNRMISVAFCLYFFGVLVVSRAHAQIRVSGSMEASAQRRAQPLVNLETLPQALHQNPNNTGPIFVGLIVGVPYTLGSLIPLIGNIVVLSKVYSQGVRMGWGVAGIVVGGLGVGFLSLFSGLFHYPITSWMVLVFPQLLVQVACIALGIGSVVVAKKRPGATQVSILPYWKPGPDGNHTFGASFTWTL